MELSRDITRLLLHPIGVRCPGNQKGGNVLLGNLEEVHQYYRGDFCIELLENRNVLIEWFELEHIVFTWCLSIYGIETIRGEF